MELLSLLPDSNLGKIILAVIAIVLIITIVQALFKLALIVFVVGAIATVFFNVTPEEYIDKTKELVNWSSEYVSETIKPIIFEELDALELQKNEDGTFVLSSSNLEVSKNNEGIIHLKLFSLDTEFNLEDLKNFFSKEEFENLQLEIEEKFSVSPSE